MGCRITKGVTEQCTVRLRLTQTITNDDLWSSIQNDVAESLTKTALLFTIDTFIGTLIRNRQGIAIIKCYKHQ